jgi:hypothetical protein
VPEPGWQVWATRAALALGVSVSAVMTFRVVSGIIDTLGQSSMAPWMLGRASGFTSYVLMMALVLMGLLMSHPGANHVRRPSRRARLRIHVALAVFTLIFTTLHVVVLATDPYAHVGWQGALLPMASQYRPVGVTLGVVAVWSALVTAVTASLAGRLAVRIWWPVHKVAAVAFVLVWAHGFLAGSDTTAMSRFYLATGGTVLLVALSRYTTTTPADSLDELMARSHSVTGPDRAEVTR